MEEREARALLDDLIAQLDAEEGANADARDVVVLDQQSVGRLSRMDALQGQAMAKAQAARRAARRRGIEAAIARLKDGTFGWCEACGDEIPEARLRLNPTATRCVGCAG
ncbi:TraR/DksA C4-type zinc finger protein [Pontivivens ytuae]|uniref:TraR/DksA C4-type zinc finger protein n=2 Tax=Pontivivens ytuae TaxID=2789856 RepID=A0A7S9LW74_9RHOB|nr:TraR/DksA C4-type zinc finger protein [Pontivivens ytuae]